MKSFEVSTTIHAGLQVVWDILTDAPAYTSWNTTVDRVDGVIALGGKVTVHARTSPRRTFPVTVVEFVPTDRMVWSSGMPLGLFRGTRTFTLAPTAEAVKFTMQEEFSGLLAPLIDRSIPDLQPAFEEFASALKRRAEQES